MPFLLHFRDLSFMTKFWFQRHMLHWIVMPWCILFSAPVQSFAWEMRSTHFTRQYSVIMVIIRPFMLSRTSSHSLVTPDIQHALLNVKCHDLETFPLSYVKAGASCDIFKLLYYSDFSLSHKIAHLSTNLW